MNSCIQAVQICAVVDEGLKQLSATHPTMADKVRKAEYFITPIIYHQQTYLIVDFRSSYVDHNTLASYGRKARELFLEINHPRFKEFLYQSTN